jgi:hypothetical protein
MRCVVNLSIGQRYLRGQDRLKQSIKDPNVAFRFYTNGYPVNCPNHQEMPFAFKAYCLKEAAQQFDQLLWCDASIVARQSLEPIWEHAAQHGVWLSKNGWKNFAWTSRAAYCELFPELAYKDAERENLGIEHVVAGAFALDLAHHNGMIFLEEYFRLASSTRAFQGPNKGPVGIAHRHDQTAASVLAWRLKIPLTDPPKPFAYYGGETDDTVLMADGRF